MPISREEKNRRNREKMARMIQKRIAAGLCYSCGENPPGEPRPYPGTGRRRKYPPQCDDCRERTRKATARLRASGQSIGQKRAAAGLCPTCGEVPESPYKSCERCREKVRRRYWERKYSGNGIAALERDGNCQLCTPDHAIKRLHVHHIDGNQQNDSMENLVILCAKCHYGITTLTTRGVDTRRAIDLLQRSL